MSRSFRFGLQLQKLPVDGWAERARRIEALGYSTVFWPDHFGTQWDPTAALAAVAAVTDELRIGTLVWGVDYRHPVVLAKSAATLHLISGGRHEFGIGAGWMETDYVEAGIPYDRPGVRIERLDEALQIIRSMWAENETSFSGKHYRIEKISQAAKLPPGERPKILVGGGGWNVTPPRACTGGVVGYTFVTFSSERTTAEPPAAGGPVRGRASRFTGPRPGRQRTDRWRRLPRGRRRRNRVRHRSAGSARCRCQPPPRIHLRQARAAT